jgi:hypothetical protein
MNKKTAIKLRPFHPLADLFPLLDGQEFDDLVKDIKQNGLREKIDLYEGKIADGRNRYRALLKNGIDPEVEPSKYFRKTIYTHTAGGEINPHDQSNDDRVRAYIISKNIHRRHLTAKQKRDLIGKLLEADPTKSDREIGRQTKSDGKTVKAVRKEKERRAEIPHTEKRTDTTGRQQSATKPKPQWWQNKEAFSKAEQQTPEVIPADTTSGTTKLEPKPEQKKAEAEYAALHDFATFTIVNVDKGDLKLSGDPERMRRWRDLKQRVQTAL